MAATAFPPPGQAWATGAAYPLDFCHLCDGPINRIAPRMFRVWTHPLAGALRLCKPHYRALAFGLRNAAGADRDTAVPRRPYVPWAEKRCAYAPCGQLFGRRPHDRQRRHAEVQFCSPACANRANAAKRCILAANNHADGAGAPAGGAGDAGGA